MANRTDEDTIITEGGEVSKESLGGAPDGSPTDIGGMSDAAGGSEKDANNKDDQTEGS